MYPKKMRLMLLLAVATLTVCTSQAQTACCSSPQPLRYWQFSEAGYNDQILGIDPGTAGTFTATVELVPIKLVFADGTSLDPTQPTCTGGSSAIQLTANSPVFQSAPFTSNGQNLGTTQFIDAYQHASLGSGILPNNHLLLGYRIYGSTDPTHVPSQVLNVPAAEGFARPAACSAAGVVSFGLLSNFVNNIFASLPANTIPVFLIYNTLINKGTSTSPSYEGGEHNFASALRTPAPYAYATFIDNYSIFNGITPTQMTADEEDVYSISHELVEIAMNPHNSAIGSPAWGHIGQVTFCTNALEVADPLSGTGFTQFLNGFNYHLPDVAFISWFFRENPSRGVNGSYSFAGGLTSLPLPCSG